MGLINYINDRKAYKAEVKEFGKHADSWGELRNDRKTEREFKALDREMRRMNMSTRDKVKEDTKTFRRLANFAMPGVALTCKMSCRIYRNHKRDKWMREAGLK